jgi:hypothetical protein
VAADAANRDVEAAKVKPARASRRRGVTENFMADEVIRFVGFIHYTPAK